jgi:hypothetical protein
LDAGPRSSIQRPEHPHLDHGYAVTSHSSQGQTANRVLINVDTEKSELLVNNRFAYVSVSRAQHEAHIYTNDRTSLVAVLAAKVRNVRQPRWNDNQFQRESNLLPWEVKAAAKRSKSIIWGWGSKIHMFGWMFAGTSSELNVGILTLK